MTTEQKDKYIADHLMGLTETTLRCMVADLHAEIETLRADRQLEKDIDLYPGTLALKREVERLAALAATHLADQELLVGRERKRVARECIDYVHNHASDCGCSKRIAHDIRERYGVEE